MTIPPSMATAAATIAPLPELTTDRRPRFRHPRRKVNGSGTQRAAEVGHTQNIYPEDLGGVNDVEECRDTGGPSGGHSTGVARFAMRPNTVAQTPMPVSAKLSSEERATGDRQKPRPSRRRGVVEDHGGGVQGSSSGRVNTSRKDAGLSKPSGREFGGHLTVDAGSLLQSEHNQTSQLQADAAEFHPGKDHLPKRRQLIPLNARATRARRASKSHAADILTRTHEDITNGHYECPICTGEVLRNSKIWSCHTCWTIFHLSCIKKWSTNEGSAHVGQRDQDQDSRRPRQWRCPGCNLPKDELPSRYTCWCEKDLEPRSISGLPPHSCGQTCGRPRTLPKKCPHPCNLVCHAGPCPPCTHAGPIQSCFCGKKSATRRCIDTDYKRGWSCGQICGDLMPCGEHTCQLECHPGLCGACEVRVDARCYCGRDRKAILCADRGNQKITHRTFNAGDGSTTAEDWIGMYQCTNTCNRLFDCGIHRCAKPCHAQGDAAEHCPQSPDAVSTCPCGKTPLSNLLDVSRQTCEDPIPNCHEPCLKPLACGHLCKEVCHLGECMPCLEKVTIVCRCGRTASKTICHQGTEEPPQCTRVCRATLNCGRHECGERCCPGERKAVERQSTKRKARTLAAAGRPVEDLFEAEHICTRPCDRKLKCGNHTCEELCHKGPCGSCREAIFDEISCNCGRTILQPPLPCGTEPPPCRYPCGRSKTCGHPQVSHNCHQDNESCPRCPFLVAKQCMCGKNTLKNQQCWLPEVRCGEICGKKLRCGSHTCQKACHRSGDCEDAGKPCHQSCGKPKKACGHPCEEPCHAPYPCREDKSCPHKAMITCECQHQKQEIRCNASKSSEGNTTKSLKCDDECARLARNRKLALALNIDPDTHKDEHVPYSAETLKLYQENVQWARDQEREFRVFAGTEEDKRLRFKPMPAPQRAFIHSLAEDYGLDSESMDPEPHRHVAVFKTPRYVSMPTKTLAECVRIRQMQAHMAGTEVTQRKQALQKLNNVANNDPFNAFLLLQPRFGLTLTELSAVVEPLLPNGKSGISLAPIFLASEEIVLRAHNDNLFSPLSENDLSLALRNLKPNLMRMVKANGLGELQLCRIDDSCNILQRETDDAADGLGSGWNRVAAKAAAPRRTVVHESAREVKNPFMVLGSKAGLSAKTQDKKQKQKVDRKKDEPVVDDWEEAQRVEEQKEEQEARRSLEGSRPASVGASGSEEIVPKQGEAAIHAIEASETVGTPVADIVGGKEDEVDLDKQAPGE